MARLTPTALKELGKTIIITKGEEARAMVAATPTLTSMGTTNSPATVLILDREKLRPTPATGTTQAETNRRRTKATRTLELREVAAITSMETRTNNTSSQLLSKPSNTTVQVQPKLSQFSLPTPLQQLPITSSILRLERMMNTMPSSSSTMEELDKQHPSNQQVQVRSNTLLKASSRPSNNNSGQTTTHSRLPINSTTMVNKHLVLRQMVNLIRALTKASISLSRNEECKSWVLHS